MRIQASLIHRLCLDVPRLPRLLLQFERTDYAGDALRELWALGSGNSIRSLLSTAKPAWIQVE